MIYKWPRQSGKTPGNIRRMRERNHMLTSSSGDSIILDPEIQFDQELINELQHALKPFLGMKNTKMTQFLMQSAINNVLEKNMR